MERHGKHPEILIRAERPFNAGSAPAPLRAGFVTPTDRFFVRNHGDVPSVDPASYRLGVRGAVERPLELTLEELGRFPRRELAVTLQCAGNRRDELARHKEIPHELPWGSEAISTARWSGPSLADVLAAAKPTGAAHHAAFTGLDETERHGERFRYGGSIPLEKALSGEVLLATEMNGEPLPPVHGYPVRVVVPGWIGARSVKWLSEIELGEEPSRNYFQRVAYRLFPAAVGPDDVDWNAGAMLGELAVNSIVTAPEPDATLESGRVRVEGLAIAGDGREVIRVEASTDGGATWLGASLEPSSERWAWRFWSLELDLPDGRHELAVRAWDSAAQTQPPEIGQVWNFKGYMNNAWQRVRFTVATP
ncbi:MAG: sulfite oxidase [Acidobacteria bacterium]|nr:sulfite oxidase [Acidobacteriota bacterium]